MTVIVPIKLVNTENAREHHMAKARRVKAQRAAAALALRCAVGPMSMTVSPGVRVNWVDKPRIPCTVTLTRIGPRVMDTDGVSSSCKAVRDEVAAWLGADDKPGSGITWRYEQRKGKAGEYACEIRIEETR